MRLLSTAAISLLLAGCVATGQEPSQTPRDTIHMTTSGASLNDHRRRAGLAPLRRSAKADRAARRHAADMNRKGFFAHRGSDGTTHTHRLRAAGCRGGAENIAAGPYTGTSVVTAWMNSRGHRRNILLPAAKSYGLANVGDKWVMVLSAGC